MAGSSLCRSCLRGPLEMAERSKDADKLMLRLPDGMRERIAERAKENGRSMNSEIVFNLKKVLEGGQIAA